MMIKPDGPAADLGEVIGERDTPSQMLEDLATAHECLEQCHHRPTSSSAAGPRYRGFPGTCARPGQQVGNRAAVTSTRNCGTRERNSLPALTTDRARRRPNCSEASYRHPPTIEVQLANVQQGGGPRAQNYRLPSERRPFDGQQQSRVLTQPMPRQPMPMTCMTRSGMRWWSIKNVDARTAKAVAEERFGTLHAELGERQMRLAELEAMLATHQHLHGTPGRKRGWMRNPLGMKQMQR